MGLENKLQVEGINALAHHFGRNSFLRLQPNQTLSPKMSSTGSGSSSTAEIGDICADIISKHEARFYQLANERKAKTELGKHGRQKPHN
jgi:hypothetical protein